MRVVLKPGKRSEFIEFLRWDAQVAAESEPGTLRFDAWEVGMDPSVFYVYEAYEDVHAFEDHQKNEPYKRWASLAEGMAERAVEVIPWRESVVSNADVRKIGP